MSIPFEQDVEIEKFVRKFKDKHTVRGEIYIRLTHSGFEVDNKPITNHDTPSYDDTIAKLTKSIREELEEEISTSNGIDLYHLINGDVEIIEELIEYYESKK